MRKILLFILLCGLSAKATFAQGNADTTFNKAKMDSLFEVLQTNNKAMMSIAISKNGQLIYSKAIGYSEIGATQKTPANPKTRYRVGSITKIFTGAMIFQLIEEGKLKLTTSLADYFPTVPNADKITIGQMLNHSSGIFNFTNDSTYTSKLSRKTTQAEMLASFKAAKPVFEPGTKHQYSNTNFILLGFIIEKLDKKPYAAALKSRITDKTGLKDTYYGGKINPSANEAMSYNWQGSWQPDTETDMSIPGGAGAIVSTATDLTSFMNALFAGKLVKETSLNTMKTITGGYGMPLFSFPFYERTTYGHNGGIDGFRSQTAYFPKDKVAFAYLANGVNTNLNDVAIGFLSILFNKPYVISTSPFTSSTLTLKTEDLDPYLGTYATAQLPVKITITKKDAVLMGQATGQPAFPLEAVKVNEFKFTAAGVVLIFDPAKKEMTLHQGGGTFVMKKE